MQMRVSERSEPRWSIARSTCVAAMAMALATALACSRPNESASGSGGWTDPDASAEGAAGNAGKGGAAGEAGVEAGACVPRTCAQLDAECGTVWDGCEGELDCGMCPLGQRCGGGGPNLCGIYECTPKTCAQLNAGCGWISDGCAAALDCGACAAPLVCGGGGNPHQCGCGTKTCSQLEAVCGSAPDGCGSKVECGSCPAGENCGGGGKANQCGPGACTPKTCSQVGASCGLVSDGCSQVIDCGTCASPTTCGGGGLANQCGCTARTCAMMGVSCGVVDDGCGQSLDCGACGQGETCAGGGIPGMCGCTCTLPHAQATCTAGVCSLSGCDADWSDCDADVATGCEADLQSDPEHCGTCSNGCSYAHAAPVCNQGQCTQGACVPGWADCDKNPSNGCEVDTDGDPDNCGACGAVCSAAGGTPNCWGGACGIECTSGLGDCNGIVADGCETNLKTSLHHCGTCSKDCTKPLPAGATAATCTTGACDVSTCAAGRVDQNDVFSDGCECITDTHPADCATAEKIGSSALPIGGSAQVSGNIVPTGDQDWFEITFGGSTKCTYHPRVELVDQSGTGLLRMAVRTSCSKYLTCSEGGSSDSATTWEFTYSKTCGTSKAIDPAKKASSPTTVQVGVFATAASKKCLPFTLKFSN